MIQHNYLVVLVAGKAVKDNCELIDGRWDKNDTKDSANAADLVSQGKCQFYEQPDSVFIAVRNLIVVRKQLKKEEHKLRMRIRNGLIVKYLPELDRYWGSCLEENLKIRGGIRGEFGILTVHIPNNHYMLKATGNRL